MMCVYCFCWFVFVTSAVLSVTVNDLKTESCSSSYSEFRCSDGNCVNVTSVCDGTADCNDGSDETSCDKDTDLDVYEYHSNNKTSLHRWKRQIRCTKNEWRCKDGTCIEFHRKCDGIPDCPDGSDETFPLCRKSECLPHWFRCTYGACVDGTAPCNRVQDCADNSDELLPRCRNESEEIRGTFKCANGQQTIPSYKHCDGTKDCSDGSDETIRACAGKTCNSYLFQCAYGACVDADSDCNGSEECADGSDESDELCNRTSTDNKPTVRPISDGACILPPFPDHGSYIVAGVPNAKPGQAFDTIGFNVTCYPGYGIQGNKRDRLCVFGEWSEEVGQCVRFCRLNKDASVDYRCILTGGSTGTRQCGEYEPDGTVVIPECNAPNYYYNGVLPYMRCIDGSWDYVARCLAECGLVTPGGTGLIAGPERKPAKRGELPWHTAIYRKTATPYQQICGGSLVSAKVAISAAHCFWNDTTKQQPAANYAVALGKIYRRWEHADDLDVQRSDVRELKLPIRFQGSTTHFQDDIAVILLTQVIVYMPHIRPVCIDFSIVFENRQLKEQNKGKVAGWGLTAEDGKASKILLVVELPYISIMECQADSPPDFRSYITGDKICAGYRNGTALCKGDSGGGLTFPESDKGQSRYYLRGIVSAAPDNDHLCNVHWLTTFTQISRHEHFIKQYL